MPDQNAQPNTDRSTGNALFAWNTPDTYRHTKLMQRIHASLASAAGSVAFSLQAGRLSSDSTALSIFGLLFHLAFLYITSVWVKRIVVKPGQWMAYSTTTMAFETLSFTLTNFARHSPALQLCGVFCYPLFLVSLYLWYRRACRACSA